MQTICAYCGVIIRPGSAPGEPVSHGICNDCRDNFLAILGIDIGKYLDMLDAPVVLVDNDATVLALNRLALQFVDKPGIRSGEQPFGNVFECANARRPEGCGHTIHCSGCVIRNTVAETARTGNPVTRRPAVLSQESPEGVRPVPLFISSKKDGDVVLLKIEPGDPGTPEGHSS